MKEKYISYRDTSIFYQVIGNGIPVVLIHGFAEDSSIWDEQVEFLKDKCMLIVPDLPGSGRSALIDKPSIGMEDYADVIRQILDDAQIDKAILIGHSMGGYITLDFAEKYPGLLTAFGLFHSSAYADDTAKVETREKAIEFIRKNGSEAFLKTSIPGLFYRPDNAEAVNTLILEKADEYTRLLELRRQVFPFLPEALVQYYQAMIARPDRTSILKGTSLPVLFIMGEYDKAVPFKHSLEQFHLPQRSYIHVLRQSAHMGMLEETQKANEILANFLLNR